MPEATTDTALTSQAGSPTIRRRRLLATAAWVTPAAVVSMAAPALAASSQCVPATGAVRFGGTGGNYTRQSPYSASALVPVTGAPTDVGPVTATFTAANVNPATPGGTIAEALNLLTVRKQDGNQYLQIANYARDTVGQRLTITFSRPVEGLTFSLYEFTAAPSAYRDIVSLTGANGGQTVGYTVGSRGSEITGSGSSADEWITASADNTAVGDPIRSANAVQNITFSDPVDSITLTYRTNVFTNTNQAQLIYMSQMNFTAVC